jgi:hypothetical protein
MGAPIRVASRPDHLLSDRAGSLVSRGRQVVHKLPPEHGQQLAVLAQSVAKLSSTGVGSCRFGRRVTLCIDQRRAKQHLQPQLGSVPRVGGRKQRELPERRRCVRYNLAKRRAGKGLMSRLGPQPGRLLAAPCGGGVESQHLSRTPGVMVPERIDDSPVQNASLLSQEAPVCCVADERVLEAIGGWIR